MHNFWGFVYALAITLVISDAAEMTKLFEDMIHPDMPDRFLGSCYAPDKPVLKAPCGKTIADWFCQRNGYNYAKVFAYGCGQNKVGFMGGEVKDCPAPDSCDAMCLIQCAKLSGGLMHNFTTVMHPTDKTRHLQHCYGLGKKPCYKPVADWWCQQKGYLFASSFKSPCGRRSISSINGEVQDNFENILGGFCYVECAEDATTTTTTTTIPPTTSSTQPNNQQIDTFTEVRWPLDLSKYLGWCYGQGSKPCGKPVADWYCQLNGYNFSTEWTNGCTAHDMGSMDDQATVCADGQCEVMCTITCAKCGTQH